MIHMGKTTTKSPEKVIEKASQFFGPGGVGLSVASRGNETIYFVGAGGHVQVSACRAQEASEEDVTDVDIQSQEWEIQARDFLSEV